jgi:PAS domain S-box-containing protein
MDHQPDAVLLPIRVLLAVDDERGVEAIVGALRGAGFAPEYRLACSEIEFLASLDWRPELVLCELELAKFDAQRALEILAEQGNDAPLVVTSDRIAEQHAATLLGRGAADHVATDQLWRVGAVARGVLARQLVEHSRREYAEALRASEQRFGAAFDSSAIGMAILAPDGTPIRVNQAMCRMLDHPEEELVGGDAHAWTHPEDLTEELRQRHRLLAGEAGSYQIEKRCHRRDGEAIWVRVTCAAMPAAGGAQQDLIAQFEDITARRRAEQALRLYERAVEASSAGIVITDALADDQPIVYCNKSFERITGHPAEEVIGRNSRFLQGPETDPAALSAIAESVAAGRDCRVTLRNYRRDGTGFWNELALSPVTDEAGRTTHFVGLLHDVTARVAAQNALAESEARFRGLVELWSGFYWEQDAELRFTRITPGGRGAVAPDADTVLGKRRWDREVLYPDAAGWAAHRAQLARREPFFDLEYGVRGPSGDVLHFRTSGMPVFGERGEFRGYRGVATDVTARRREEERICRLSSLYAALIRSARALVYAPDPETLLRDACRLAVEGGPLRMACAQRADGRRHLVTPIAAAGVPAEAVELFQARIDLSTPAAYGPAEVAFRTGRPCVINDAMKDRAADAWRDAIASAGLGAIAIFPLTEENAIAGLWVLGAEQRGLFEPEVCELLGEMASQISFVLGRFARDARRLRSQGSTALP